MSLAIINNSPYLRTTRTFPTEPQPLSVEITKSYLDIANVVNERTIGIYATSPSITGNTWFLTGSNTKQQTLRKVFPLTGPAPIAINHGITFTSMGGFVHIYGTFTDGTNWYPLPYVDVAAAGNQIQVVINGTQILITAGAGAPPVITTGTFVIEWLSQT